ncbi:DUF4175 family protein [Algibacter mikhailovii]|uniref:ATPase n=1 Tax=Algibacter mikhailovii TaxID=425498 RepID=A0A918R8R0_9FLAO|nr:DUF4175 family protein [Algibacter mikhailovii]GGZ89430.1 ATPase [Algibacter mikhailovii]
MTSFNSIQNKLEGFIRKFYTNELLKGSILFFAIGFLYFLLTLFIEHILWLNTGLRTVLFWMFITVEIGLLVKFILIPLFKLLKLKKGIDYEIASKIIGRHFPEVSDKLLNVLQLHNTGMHSDLLLASIEQKSAELKPVPFKLAINFKKNLKYLKYAAIPVAILFLTFLTGHMDWFSTSYKRVIDYNTAYEPPAPFHFYVVNESLNGIENENFRLIVKTTGKVIPEYVEISYNNETYFLQEKGVGEFEYVFVQPKEDINFQLSANDVNSKPYVISIIRTPSLLNFEMSLDYPKHTRKRDEVFKSTGNAMVPEGTKITWLLNTKATDEVSMYAQDTLSFVPKGSGRFETAREVFNDLNYTLSTSNAQIKNYENLGFNIDVIKDEFPDIALKVEKDSLDLESLYFFGQISDDYGFTKLQLVYYPADDVESKELVVIPIGNSNVEEFVSAFPSAYQITPGVSYKIYFQVLDNDIVNSYKSAKSSVITFRKRTKDEEALRTLKEQKEGVKDLDKSLQKINEQDKRLEAITKTQKEKSTLNFNDKKKLDAFLERQKQQDQMMKNFNKKFKENLKKFDEDSEEIDEFRKDLEKRLDDNEEQLEKNEKLLEEIEKLQEKISKEELTQKLDELAKQNKNKKRSLEQLLELTKRFYVEKKLEKLKDDLRQLANEQEELSKKTEEENTEEKQEELNKAFEDYKKELDELEQESKDLKKPIDIPRDKLDEGEVEKEQEKALEALEREKEENDNEEDEGAPKPQSEQLKKAKSSQKKAAQKMKEMSQKMESAMQSGGGEQMQEDSDMLRQILDNLVLFSLDQEDLMNQFKAIEVNHNRFANYLKRQNSLREHFEHIDDSLFALSLRQPKLSEDINTEIAEVYYNIDRSLDLFAENQLYQGVSSQQFAVTGANNLADFLSDILDNMQESMSMSSGSGGEGEMQLPDIIMGQKELNEMMEKGMKKGKQGEPNDGEGEEKGEGKKPGNEGEKGEGKNGGQGKEGGQSGRDGTEDNEGQEELLYQIYQQQEKLRQALKDRLGKNGNGRYEKAVLKRMESIESDLLNRGFTQETLQKMMALEHQLLKLENASLEQGKENKRKAETNTTIYSGNGVNQVPKAREYFKSTEILNRQALPLQPVYKRKVQEYFKESND